MDPNQVTIEDWDSDGAIRIPDDVLQALSVDVGSILYMKVLPDDGGDTCFASMYWAYETLSDKMKAYLEGLTAPEGWSPDTVVSVDIAARGLFPENARCYLERVDLAIDHHPSQEFFARETCLDAGRAACGELIYDIAGLLGPVTREMAVPLYVAVSTDTGCFVYGNTTADTHRTAAALMETGIPAAELNKRHFRTKTLKRLRIESRIVEGMELFDGGETAVAAVDLAMVAQLGADERDLEDIASFVGQVEGVKNAITIRELRPGTCKLSLRTDPEVLNASRVCALLGGGGHAAASGATVEGSVEEAKRAILWAIEQVRHG